MRSALPLSATLVLLLSWQSCLARDIYQQPKKEQQQQQASNEPAAALVPEPIPAQTKSSNSINNRTSVVALNSAAGGNRTGPGMPTPAAGVGLKGMLPIWPGTTPRCMQAIQQD
jgi:hypothetical protein